MSKVSPLVRRERSPMKSTRIGILTFMYLCSETSVNDDINDIRCFAHAVDGADPEISLLSDDIYTDSQPDDQLLPDSPPCYLSSARNGFNTASFSLVPGCQIYFYPPFSNISLRHTLCCKRVSVFCNYRSTVLYAPLPLCWPARLRFTSSRMSPRSM